MIHVTIIMCTFFGTETKAINAYYVVCTPPTAEYIFTEETSTGQLTNNNM